MNTFSRAAFSFKALDYSQKLTLTLFAHVQHLPWASLLRSASDTHIDSRFDILVANPIATIETRDNQSHVWDGAARFISQDDPFQVIHSLQTKLLPALNDIEKETLGELQLLPFIGGALGLFSYDLGRQIERLPQWAEHDLRTADMAVGLYEWAIVADHLEQKAWIVGHNIEQAWQWLNAQKAPLSVPFHLLGEPKQKWLANMSREQYQHKFEQIQHYLLSGDCYQINLAQRFCAAYNGDEWLAYQALEAHNQAPFSAFLRTEESAILSVSPERFIQFQHGVIETKPIKGTRPRSQDAATDKRYATELAHSEKDQSENLMIVDLLRNDIGRVATPGSVHVPKLFEIESFPAVHHLVSTIRASLDEQYQPIDLLRAAFPGGSITGAPKVRAMEIIEELEPQRRSAYCGSIGYLSRHGKMDTSITIRTLVAEQGRLYVWAGGAIVADSDCDAEYQETHDKLSKILPVLERLG
ncbi:aminodeoxychorismate synthase component I [Vibrio sp. SM6]|uniref:aminodeoxychorismate synthase n=1 Tax=Vibrio agarilyticus TaxID=2726741 RepID=A0A7X8TPP2_9VIBR|nr:aminodeoxychorismate synthase component I [Vibrio agarilyticus]NLS12635.1 aminodeoxychorismate synthase component I [Vibrio agarilyticus]